MNVRGALVAALAALLLALPFAAVTAFAEPPDAMIAPTTIKPWLATPATTASETQTSAPQASVRPPSALRQMAAEEPSATPSPTPTATPGLLPGALGLRNATRIRILLIGTDAYTIKQKGRSDTMILVQLDVDTGEVKMVSFLRDLYVAIPGHGKTRLNAAYVYGGAELLLQTLENNFGVRADRTVAVNFSLMVEVIDRIGGVTVEVKEKERVQLNSILKYYNTQNGYGKNDGLLQQSGKQALTGKQALCYSRIRKIDSDFQRVSRQRKVLEAVYVRVRELDAVTLGQIAFAVLPDIRTDMTLTDVASLIPVLINLRDVRFSSLTVPINGGYSSETRSGMSVLVPYLEKNQNAISSFLD